MASSFKRIVANATILVVLSLPLLVALSKAQTVDTPTEEPEEHVGLNLPDAETREIIDGCMACHAKEAEGGPPVDVSHLLQSPHAPLGCNSCHPSITEAPHTEEMLADKPACANCHPDISEAFETSVHARPDKKEGDHPSCITCHGAGDPHSVKLYDNWTREDKVKVCSDCHRQEDRMKQYGPNTGSVSSYEHSFHGRALLKYDSQTTAICVDCHGSHGVLSHTDPKSMTHKNQLVETCGKCHPGAGPNFSVSGSNHMDLTIEREPILHGILVFFKVLVAGMASFLMFGVVLDLRRSLFGKKPPRVGRFVGTLVSLGFLSIVVAIAQATFGFPGGRTSTLIGAGLLFTAVMIYKVRARLANGGKAPKPEKVFDRYNASMRIQHMALMISFTILIFTGMPVRNPETETLRQIYLSLGGLEVGRVAHRAAGVLLIVTFLYHVLELLWKWKNKGFAWSAWTMLPTKQDVLDFITETKSYLGMDVELPKYGRYHFREKLDYFAEYWGIPLMVISGLILWFPVQFGNVLHPIAIPIAFIAHSYEAVLAFIAILTWHLYNSYFNVNHFATNAPWNIGILSHEDMMHKHPKELEEHLEKLNGDAPKVKPEDAPAPTLEPEPDPESAPEPEDPVDPEPKRNPPDEG